MSWAKRGGGGAGGAAKVAQLQPVDASVVAAWKTEYIAGGFGVNGLQLVDYSGNGNSCDAASGLITVNDNVPGRLCSAGWMTDRGNPPNPLLNYSSLNFQCGMSCPAHKLSTELLGDMTFTTTLSRNIGQGAYPEPAYIYAHGDASGAGSGISFGVGLFGGSYELFVYWEGVGGANPSVVKFSTAPITQQLNTGLWSFLSVVRNAAAKTLQLGINGVYETKPYTVDPPASNANRYPFIGAPPSSALVLPGVIGFPGRIPNPVIRNATKTTAQLEAIRAFTMGL